MRSPVDPARRLAEAAESAEAVEDSPMAGEKDAVMDTGEPLTPLPESAKDIPQFWFPGEGGRGRGRPDASEALAQRAAEIDGLFNPHAGGIAVDDFVAVTKDLCAFPSFFNAPLFNRILRLFDPTKLAAVGATEQQKTTLEAAARITREAFDQWWVVEMEPFDRVERFWRLVKQPDTDAIVKEDLAPYLDELLTYHPGLEFLESTPEFQEKYALTVSIRIFYGCNLSHTGRITLRELRQSKVVDAFTVVDEEEDINKVGARARSCCAVHRFRRAHMPHLNNCPDFLPPFRRVWHRTSLTTPSQVNAFFSYEHFYVLYCKFWELDTDHDFVINRDDLMKYARHSLTRAVVDRIFSHGVRPFGRMQTQNLPEHRDAMAFEDFVYFMLSGALQSLLAQDLVYEMLSEMLYEVLRPVAHSMMQPQPQPQPQRRTRPPRRAWPTGFAAWTWRTTA